MDCRTAQRLISLFLDNELLEEKALELNEHLAQCPECNAEMVVLKRAIDAMDAWQDLQPHFTLADIQARVSTRRPWWERIHLPERAPGWATALGVALCICTGVVGGISLDGARQSTDRTAAVDAIVTGFDDPIGDALPWLVQAGSDSHSTNRQQEDSL